MKRLRFSVYFGRALPLETKGALCRSVRRVARRDRRVACATLIRYGSSLRARPFSFRDWRQDAALSLGRRRGRLGLALLGQLAGRSVRRFGQRPEREAKLRWLKLEAQLSIIEMWPQ
jgi:hypothetical protein